MRITWLGHACFTVEHKDYRVVIDPFRGVPGFPDVCTEAEEVLCSHGHFDHAYREGVTLCEGKPSPFTVQTLESFHDDKGGALRGENRLHILRADGLTVVHLGDLGHPLDAAQTAALRGCDVLLVPVGGTYTVDGDTAAAIVRALQPRVVIPMHYRGEGFGFDNIDTADTFHAHFPAESVRRYGENRIDVTEETVPHIAVLARNA